MVAFLSIVIAVALLGITVYGLHRYQTMEVEYQVDRSMPLPPLEGDSDRVPDAAQSKQAVTAEASLQRAPGASSSPAREAPRVILPQPRNWLEQVAVLKQQGDLDSALTLCREEFPLWGAYNQACILRRAQLKTADPESEHAERLLLDLYRLAATAELLHDKSPGTEQLSLGQLKEMNLQPIEELDFPYSRIGYAQLRLIRKSDIRMMLARWGRPEQHLLPRQHHQSWRRLLTLGG